MSQVSKYPSTFSQIIRNKIMLDLGALLSFSELFVAAELVQSDLLMPILDCQHRPLIFTNLEAVNHIGIYVVQFPAERG